MGKDDKKQIVLRTLNLNIGYVKYSLRKIDIIKKIHRAALEVRIRKCVMDLLFSDEMSEPESEQHN
jgi:hypothetical protein